MVKPVWIAGLAMAATGGGLLGVANWADSGSNPADPMSLMASAQPPAVVAMVAERSLPPTEYTFRRTVPEVRLQFTVTDAKGKLVQGLRPNDVRVLDQWVEVQHFDEFTQDFDLPLRLGVVLDVSNSVKKLVPEEKTTALAFLKQIMRPAGDRVFLMAVGSEVKLWQDETGDAAALADAVGRIQQPGASTYLYDGLYSACSQQLAKPEFHAVQRALIVLSDGDDNGSLHGLADVLQAAQRAEIQIYTLTIHPRRDLWYRGDQTLRQLADETGGQFLVINGTRDLSAAFDQIEKALRTQYTVAFRPRNESPGYHELGVEVPELARSQVHARKAYFVESN